MEEELSVVSDELEDSGSSLEELSTLELDSSSLLEEVSSLLDDTVALELDAADELDLAELLEISSSSLDEDLALEELSLRELEELLASLLLEAFFELLEYTYALSCGVLLSCGPLMVESVVHATMRAKTRNRESMIAFFMIFLLIRIQRAR